MGLILTVAGNLAAAENSSKEVKLSFSTKRSVNKLTWPMKVRRSSVKLDSTESIYGVEVAIYGKRGRRGNTIQLDCNGNGKFSKKETKIYKSRPVSFMVSGRLGDKKKRLPLFLEQIFVYRGGEVYAKKYPGWAMSGKFGKKKIYLIDANLDGKFDASGKDYIAVDSKYAIPLSGKTSIDGIFYDVSVAEDGSKITFTKIEPESLCKVKLKKGLKSWSVFAITNNEGTYNIAAKNCNKVPPGEYRLCYGLYGNGSSNLYLEKCPEFEIRSGNKNTLNIGKPFSLKFTAKLSGSNVIVDPTIKIVGLLGEEYYLNTKAKRLPPPSISIMAGRKRVASGAMGYG